MVQSSRMPIILANTNPFRLVFRDTDIWNTNINDLYNGSYDYVKLHRVSKFIDVGIEPFKLGIGFDGTLFLPALNEFTERFNATEKFNQTLGYLLVGGVYSESISPENVYFGSLSINGYYRSSSVPIGTIAMLHSGLRTQYASKLDIVKLLSPRTITVDEIVESYERGRSIISQIQNFSPSLLLNGITYYIKHQWSEALTLLWTSIEEVISHLWIEYIFNRRDEGGTITNRSRFLKDYRTWTSSAKIELLYQRSLISANVYNELNNARKARNTFIHEGLRPSQDNVFHAISALFRMISLTTTDFQNEIKLDNVMDLIMDNFKYDLIPEKSDINPEEIDVWLKIPPIPGDADYEGDIEEFNDFKLIKLDDERAEKLRDSGKITKFPKK